MVLVLFTMFWLPQDILSSGEALKPWQKLFAMVDQLLAFKVFSGLLVLWVVWTDLRPFVLRRLNLEQDLFSLADLAKLAQSRHGWKFGNDSFESLDFIDAMRQSGVDGTLPFLGRFGCHQVPADLKAAYPLVDISQAHFVNHWIDVPNFFGGTENYNISTHFPTRPKDETFRDLHIKTKQAAKKWLSETAPKWRGLREEADKMAKVERDKRLTWIKKDEDRVGQPIPNTEEQKQP